MGVGLHELHRLVVEHRREQPGDPVGSEAGDVAVDPHHEVAAAGHETRPQHVALAVTDPVDGVDVLDRHDLGPCVRRDPAVSSVLRSSITISSSTRGTRSTSSRRIVATSGPMVAASSRHGMHTDTVRPDLASATAASPQSSISNVADAGHLAPLRRGTRWLASRPRVPLRRGQREPRLAQHDSIATTPEAVLGPCTACSPTGPTASTSAARVQHRRRRRWCRGRPSGSGSPRSCPALAALGVPLSIDSWRPEVVRLALEHGADRDQRGRRHAERRDVARRRRLRGADRRAVPAPGPTLARWRHVDDRPGRRAASTSSRHGSPTPTGSAFATGA